MSAITDLLFELIRNTLLVLLLPVIILAAFSMMIGGRPELVFRRCFFLLISMTRLCFKLTLALFEALFLKKRISTRRYPRNPFINH